jgi:hypothetical protein
MGTVPSARGEDQTRLQLEGAEITTTEADPKPKSTHLHMDSNQGPRLLPKFENYLL